jgi:hypothetical protein
MRAASDHPGAKLPGEGTAAEKTDIVAKVCWLGESNFFWA